MRTPLSFTISRKVGVFSQRDTVGCEHRSFPVSGNRPQASLKPISSLYEAVSSVAGRVTYSIISVG